MTINKKIVKEIDGINNNIKIFKEKDSKVCLKQYKKSNKSGFIADLFILKKKTNFIKPKIIEISKEKLSIKMSYLQGSMPMQIDKKKMSQIINFAKEFSKLRINFLAKESIFDSNQLLMQIKKKLENIKKIKNKKIINFCKDVEKYLNKKKQTIRFKSILSSPGDFGMQNILDYKGKLQFIDFEHCGKDSAVKFLCDFLLHPKNQKISVEEKVYFIRKLTEFNVINKQTLKLSAKFMFLFYIRWSLIILASIFKHKKKNKSDLINEKLSLIKKIKKNELVLKKRIYEKILR